MVPKAIIACALAVLLAGCALTPPPIAKEADKTGAGISRERFQRYVPIAYPVGSDAAQLESVLRSQGFSIGRSAANEIVAQDKVWYCDGGYFVWWTVDPMGRISTISADELYCAGP